MSEETEQPTSGLTLWGRCVTCDTPLVKNPHPDAGKPEALNRVGALYVCVPCVSIRANSRRDMFNDFRQWLEKAIAEGGEAGPKCKGVFRIVLKGLVSAFVRTLREFDRLEEARKKSIRG